MNPANAFTERLLRSAGIGAGMRVLDLGCGRGDVALLAAELVGPAGAVVGVDRDGAAIAEALERARGCPHVSFVAASLDVVELPAASFDAIVARRVLMYLPAPRTILSRLVAALRPGGVVAVQEHDATMVPVGRPAAAARPRDPEAAEAAAISVHVSGVLGDSLSVVVAGSRRRPTRYATSWHDNAASSSLRTKRNASETATYGSVRLAATVLEVPSASTSVSTYAR